MDLCLPPIIPSETTAERSASIAASIAIVVAGVIKLFINAKSNCGREGVGIVLGISPNLLPIVSTFKLNIDTIAVDKMITIIEPGIFLDTLCQKPIINKDPPPIINAQ